MYIYICIYIYNVYVFIVGLVGKDTFLRILHDLGIYMSVDSFLLLWRAVDFDLSGTYCYCHHYITQVASSTIPITQNHDKNANTVTYDFTNHRTCVFFMTLSDRGGYHYTSAFLDGPYATPISFNLSYFT
jgi:hypothetical protein